MKLSTKILLCAATIAALFVAPTPTPAYQAIQGIYINGVSNVVTVANTAKNTCVIGTQTTNYFNLSATSGQQSDTNLWPSITLANGGLNGEYLAIQTSLKNQSSNTTAVTYRWASSVDGSHWTSNALVYTVTPVSSNTASALLSTNKQGIVFFGLYSVENTDASNSFTNHWIGAVGGGAGLR